MLFSKHKDTLFFLFHVLNFMKGRLFVIFMFDFPRLKILIIIFAADFQRKGPKNFYKPNIENGIITRQISKV